MPEPGHSAYALGLALLVCACVPTKAQGSLSLDAASEASLITAGARDVTWWTNRIALNTRIAPATGWYLAAENQKRERDTDAALSGGVYGRIGQWLLSGQVSAAANPAFMPRYALEPQLGRQFGAFVVQAGAVYKSFADSRVRIGTLSLTGYRGDSELELKVAYGDSQPFDRRIRVATLRGLWDPGGMFTIGAGFSTGQGLYDSINLPGIRGNQGRIVNINLRYRIDAAHSIRLDLSDGREHPSFRERGLGLSFRKLL